jgi:hypothetical protein
VACPGHLRRLRTSLRSAFPHEYSHLNTRFNPTPLQSATSLGTASKIWSRTNSDHITYPASKLKQLHNFSRDYTEVVNFLMPISRRNVKFLLNEIFSRYTSSRYSNNPRQVRRDRMVAPVASSIPQTKGTGIKLYPRQEIHYPILSDLSQLIPYSSETILL